MPHTSPTRHEHPIECGFISVYKQLDTDQVLKLWLDAYAFLASSISGTQVYPPVTMITCPILDLVSILSNIIQVPAFGFLFVFIILLLCLQSLWSDHTHSS